MTIRNLLIDNLRDQVEPSSINQLAEMSGIHRATISKMQNGDYSKVHYKSIEKVFNALGYQVDLDVKKKEYLRHG